jgi:phytoene dehydrogenase-like protein
MTEKSYDAIIIGGGHNGLTLAAYLQRAGMQVAIFERRHEEGGPVFTSECTAPGFLHNLHANMIAFTKDAPFYQDFKLEELGCRFVYPEAQSGIAFSDGRPPVILYRSYRFDDDEENYKRTHRSISVYSKQDADTFVELLQNSRAIDASGAGFPSYAFNPPPLPDESDPDPLNTMGIAMCQILGLPLHYAKSNAKTIIDSLFESPELRALLYRQSEEFGNALEMTGAGMYAISGLTWAAVNWGLSIGGTHSIAHAMVMACIREGVHFFESCAVKKILIKNGKAVGVRLVDGTEVMARKLVASNAALKQTLLSLVGEDNLSPLWVRRARDFDVTSTSIMASTAWALHEAPDYKSAHHNPDINKTWYTVVGYDGPEDVAEYCRDVRAGRVPRIPGIGCWVNSLWDPTCAPPGKHNLTGWIWFPHVSALSLEEWEEVRATYNEKFINHFSRWAPNMTRANAIADYFYTPLDQQNEMGLMEGCIYGGSLQPDQLGHNRPFFEASHYRTEVKDLYLCGPYMHPGGGVHTGNGYNAFKIIAEDFGLEKCWENTDRGY